MVDAAVPLKVAGQTYRVVTSADADDLARLAKVVEAALAEVTPAGKQPSPQALVLAAISLAHELEEERGRRLAVEARHRRVQAALQRGKGVLPEIVVIGPVDRLDQQPHFQVERAGAAGLVVYLGIHTRTRDRRRSTSSGFAM